MTPELLSDPNALLGFGLGAAAGYMFAMVTSRAEAKKLLERMLSDRDKRISDLEGKISELERRLYGGAKE